MVRMARPLTRTLPRTLAAALVLALGATTAACGSDESKAGGDTGSKTEPAASATEASSSPTPTKKPEFTEPGTELEVGQPATVKWRANQKKRGKVRITVTSLEKTTFKQAFSDWKLSDQVRSSTPYFIRATVRNMSATNLGGFVAPLYGLDSSDTPYEPGSFNKPFAPCPNASLPKKFGKGATAKVCLVVYVRPGDKLVGATYWPDQKVGPITWTGPVEDFLTKLREQQKKGKAGKGAKGPTKGNAPKKAPKDGKAQG